MIITGKFPPTCSDQAKSKTLPRCVFEHYANFPFFTESNWWRESTRFMTAVPKANAQLAKLAVSIILTMSPDRSMHAQFTLRRRGPSGFVRGKFPGERVWGSFWREVSGG